MAYFDFLNVVFAPLFKVPALLAIIILSFLISLLIIILTKYMTDQALMKKLKEDIKEYQKQIKGLKGNPSEAMAVQKKAMELNMKYMMQSLKPTFIAFLPIIIIFGWMSSTFAYESIKPQQDFSVTLFLENGQNGEAEIIVPEGFAVSEGKIKKIEGGKVSWTLNGVEGEHILEFAYGGEKLQHSVLITNENRYLNPSKKTEGAIKLIQIDYKKLVLLPIGYRDWFGWLGIYIISSIIFTLVLRKVMKVY